MDVNVKDGQRFGIGILRKSAGGKDCGAKQGSWNGAHFEVLSFGMKTIYRNMNVYHSALVIAHGSFESV